MKIFVFGILCSLLFSTAARLGVCIHYLLNQKYYAEVLCVNRKVKNSCCKGKCAVEKRLANLGEKESSEDATPLLKLGKAEEALCYGFRWNRFSGPVETVTSPFMAVYCNGYEQIPLRPPLI